MKSIIQTSLFNFDSSNSFSTIPDSLIADTRDTVFSTWQIIELQLSKVDPVKDPDVYQALDCRANTLFNSWLKILPKLYIQWIHRYLYTTYKGGHNS